MNKLWTFGCSFTAGFTLKPYPDGPNFDMRFKDYRGGTIPPTWNEIVAEKLGFELNNKAIPGASNYETIERFCFFLHEIKKGDVVIVEWTRVFRYRYGRKTFLNNLLPSEVNTYKDRGYASKETLSEFFLNRDDILWKDEVYSWMNFIMTACKAIGVEIYFWSADDKIINSETIETKTKWPCLLPEADIDMMKFLVYFGATSVFDETKHLVPDSEHYGEGGHRVMGNIFFDEITRYRSL